MGCKYQGRTGVLISKLKTEGLKNMSGGVKDVSGGSEWSQLVKGKEESGNYGEKGRGL